MVRCRVLRVTLSVTARGAETAALWRVVVKQTTSRAGELKGRALTAHGSSTLYTEGFSPGTLKEVMEAQAEQARPPTK